MDADSVTDRLAQDIAKAITTLRPDVRVEGFMAHYPYGEAPLDLRKLAAETVSLGTYHL